MNAGGFESQVRLHHRRFLAYALALTRSVDAAEDLVQDALLIAHRDLAKYDSSRDFGAWVRGIVRMKYLEWTRAHRSERIDGAVLDAIERQHQAWDHAAEDGREDAVTAVRDCLRKIGPHLGETLDLFYRAEEPCTAIAGRLGITEVVVRKRLQRARESLAECIRRRLARLGG
jgi:RNA polymerase sigma factor (sigma-70 family)